MAWLPLLTLFAYLLLSYHFWHTRWRQTTAVTRRQIAIEHAILAVVLVFHACFIFSAILQKDHLYFGSAEALSVVAWIALLSYWFATFFVRLDGLQPILFFVSALFIGVTLVLHNGYHVVVIATPLFKTHFILAMLAYGLMLYAVWLALLIWVAERQLHFSRGKNVLHRLPSLLTLEKYLFGSITIGFILLTCALITGFSFPEAYRYGPVFYASHKVIFALLSWGVFALLLWGRWRRGWRGRFAVNWVIIGFILLVLSYIGTRFVLDLIARTL